MVKKICCIVLFVISCFNTLNAQKTYCNYTFKCLKSQALHSKIKTFIDEYSIKYSMYEDSYVYVTISNYKDSLTKKEGVKCSITYSFFIYDKLLTNTSYLFSYKKNHVIVNDLQEEKRMKKCQLMKFFKENYRSSYDNFKETGVWRFEYLIHNVPYYNYYFIDNVLVKEEFLHD